MKNTRLEGLDLFRGLAAMCVVGFHFWWGLHIPKFNFGFLAVDLFFVLSGIVLGRNYESKILNGLSFSSFAWQRLRRLYPMLLIVTSAILAMDALGIPPSIGSADSFGPALALSLLLPYSHTFGSGALFAADSPVWSLWAELVINVIWFIALRAGRHFTRNLFLASAALFIVVVLFRGTIDAGVKSGFDSMALAVLRALAWFGVGYAISMRKIRPLVPAWAALLCMAVGCAFVQREWLGGVAQLFVVVSGVALLLSLMQWSPRGVVVGKVCAWLGMVSYPLYLTHMIAARVGLWAVSHGVKVLIAYGGSFVVVAIAATALNEWVVNRLPAQFPGWRGRWAHLLSVRSGDW